jgi:hypothetical protein
MKIHILGAGPTGMSLAWEILKSGDHDVTIYDRKKSAGGSWWEPGGEKRDLHAHRIVFDRAFVNTRSLFDEMGIGWEEVFEPVEKNIYTFMFDSLRLSDYLALTTLALRVLIRPTLYKGVSFKDALGNVSEQGQAFLEHLPLIMDGVTWDVMSAYEFVKSFDHVAMSKQYTQSVSGKVMCDKMEQALLDAGANFVFNVELTDIEYGEDTFTAKLSDGRILTEDMLFLCIDNSPALQFLGTNWGKTAESKVRESTYGAINILLDYEDRMTLEDDLKIAATTEWNLQPVVLADGKTISCVICDLNETILTTDPETLKAGVLRQLELPEPKEIRIGWGAEWKGKRWEFSQSSGVLSLYGQLPFFGECSKVAMCGMMSRRNTPYSSIEAAIEVSRSLSHEQFGTREPLEPLLLTQLLSFIFVLLIVLILLYRNRNQ